MKNAADLITASRIGFAIAMLLFAPFSAAFWVCYLCAGLSDLLDGPVARAQNKESDFGARLDSVADFVFVCAIAGVVVIHVSIPTWLWVCAALIALLRFLGYAIGYGKYHAFSALHTYANKAAGVLLFASPLIFTVLGIKAGGILLCAVAAASAVEEVFITIRSIHLDRDRKSVFVP